MRALFCDVAGAGETSKFLSNEAKKTVLRHRLKVVRESTSVVRFC